jgi:hypothetical protein
MRDLDDFRPDDYRNTFEFRYFAPMVAGCDIGRRRRHGRVDSLATITGSLAAAFSRVRVDGFPRHGRERCRVPWMGRAIDWRHLDRTIACGNAL